jgi:ABC-2 type transport system permease protein
LKAIAVFHKTLREVRRDWVMLALTIGFAPFFVMIYYFALPDAIATQTLAIVNDDRGMILPGDTPLRAGDDLVAAIAATRTAEGKALIKVIVVDSKTAGLRQLRDREASALLIFPADLSVTLAAWRIESPEDASGASPPPTHATLQVTGDLTNPSYVVTAVLAQSAIDGYVRETTRRDSPLVFAEEPLGGSAIRSDFDVYVAGLLIFSIIMLVFLTAMTIARDTETGSMRRLRLTRMTAVDYLAGTSAVLLLVAVASVLATFATAAALGFTSQGPLWVAAVVVIVTALAVIGVGMMTGACARTVNRAFVLANFPFGLLAFLSGTVYPMPKTTLLRVADHPIGAFDLLPTTHAVSALNKVFTSGTGLGDVAYELSALVVLTVLYFAAGALLLRRATRHAA